MQSCQNHKGDKRKKTPHTTATTTKAALLSAITVLSPAHAWKEALSSATGKKNQLRKAKFEQRIPVISKLPM